MAPFEDAARLSLPLASHGVEVSEIDGDLVSVTIGGARCEVPRYWFARMLFRLALHGYALGYIETYGGFFYDDQPRDDAKGRYHLGIRGGGHVTLSRSEVEEVVERLYRAVAPNGYTERLQ
jgi:hypothetical protein